MVGCKGPRGLNLLGQPIQSSKTTRSIKGIKLFRVEDLKVGENRVFGVGNIKTPVSRRVFERNDFIILSSLDCFSFDKAGAKIVP